ncbi:hypothetical protein LPW11_20570 [Geomonas sp. RF6]|uniref:hypothetical protein n=1 Tax=Geomonas sp. RF6 TaxID=2897342 RepID=UPI001E394765|nr:hypothetical protein [Geomonas sp. RF6]UFS70256.1 hypothetical protein LPW11_20570 [Geomonas sp. RF6]
MSMPTFPSEIDEDEASAPIMPVVENLGPPPGDKILATFRFDSIYSDSLVEITLVSSKPFTVCFNCKIVHVAVGVCSDYVGSRMNSVQKDGSYRIVFHSLGCIKQLSVESPHGDGPHASYGMRWFPFVSSSIQCAITANLAIACVVLDAPDAFRLIWYSADVKDPDCNKAMLSHSYAPDRSKYVFMWDDDTAPGEYRISSQIRLGGMILLKALNIPMYYGILTLIGTAAASFQSKSLALGAVVAAWLFLLRQWSSLALPQRNILLTRIYQAGGLVIAAWTLMWVYCGWAGLSAIVAISLAYYRLSEVMNDFSFVGRLPPHWEQHWSQSVYVADLSQKTSLRNKQLVPQLPESPTTGMKQDPWGRTWTSDRQAT